MSRSKKQRGKLKTTSNLPTKQTATSTRPKIYASTSNDAVSKPGNTNDQVRDRDIHSPWMPFFKDSNNVYVNDLAKRARRSPTHGAIIRYKTSFTVGQGFEYVDSNGDVVDLGPREEEFVGSVDGKMTSLAELSKLYTHNFIESGNCYVQVSRSGGVTSFFNQDAANVRISKDGLTAYISDFWREIRDNTTQNDFPIEQIEMWDGDPDTTQTDFIVHLKQAATEFRTYGIPEYIGMLKWADIEYEIPTYNIERFDKDFMLSGVGTMVGEPPEGMSAQKYLESVSDKLSGEGNRGKVVLQLVDDSSSQKFEWTEISQIRDGEFKELNELAVNLIVAGHRWSVFLMGQAAAEGIGGSEKILQAWQLAMNTVIKPDFQQPLQKLTNLLINFAGFDFGVKIINKPPVQPEVDATQVMTINEQREVLGLPADETKEGMYLSDSTVNAQPEQE